MSIKEIGKLSRSCEMCGKYKMNGYFYNWIALLTKDKLVVCYNCAMREEYGSKYTQNKRWINEVGIKKK